MASHLVLVPAFDGISLRKAGQRITYVGKPDWKFQPLDHAAVSIWAASVKRPRDADAQIAKANRTSTTVVDEMKKSGMHVREVGVHNGRDTSAAIKERLAKEREELW